MKQIFFIFTSCLLATTFAKLQCSHKKPEIPTEWVDMASNCTAAVKGQIKEELKAAIQYLAMAAHFSTDSINRPGFAKFFFESASEEREHAINLIGYLLMRGELTSEVTKLIKTQIQPVTTVWPDGVSALKDALRLEAFVTKSIRNVISICEDPKVTNNFNDYHAVDFLTSVYLEEQYKGQRKLAEKVSILDKLMASHATLGEFLFDKRLLSNDF